MRNISFLPELVCPPPEQLLRGGLAGGESKNSPACFIWSEIRCPARKSRIIRHVLQGMAYNLAGYRAASKKNQIQPNPPIFGCGTKWVNSTRRHTYMCQLLRDLKIPMSQSLKENDCVPSKAILPIFCSCVQGVISLYGRVIELHALCPNWCCI